MTDRMSAARSPSSAYLFMSVPAKSSTRARRKAAVSFRPRRARKAWRRAAGPVLTAEDGDDANLVREPYRELAGPERMNGNHHDSAAGAQRAPNTETQAHCPIVD